MVEGMVDKKGRRLTGICFGIKWKENRISKYMNDVGWQVLQWLTGKNWKENTKYINYFDIYGRGYGWQIREKGDRHLYLYWIIQNWKKIKKNPLYVNDVGWQVLQWLTGIRLKRN